MHRITPLRRTFVMVLLAGAAACATAQPSPRAGGSPQREIEAVLQESARAWNRGDLDGFLLPYLNSPQTTYIARDVIRGVPAIRESYATSWFRGGAPAGQLAYDRIEARPLGRDYALVLGHWTVTRANQQPLGGIFSLTFMRTPQGWRIIHDHSS
jgi:beta-aspartyl-peptidase (threonine type)